MSDIRAFHDLALARRFAANAVGLCLYVAAGYGALAAGFFGYINHEFQLMWSVPFYVCLGGVLVSLLARCYLLAKERRARKRRASPSAVTVVGAEGHRPPTAPGFVYEGGNLSITGCVSRSLKETGDDPPSKADL